MNRRIQRMFSDLPGVYERVNHLLTFGLDILWRKRFVSDMEAIISGDVLDVCSGTGETAVYIRERYPDVSVTALDFSEPMLRRLAEKPAVRGIGTAEGGVWKGGIRLVGGDAERLPFDDATFNVVTVSFAIRNLKGAEGGLDHIFREFRRVLRPGGWFFGLETSRPRCAAWRIMFHGVTSAFVAPIGGLFTENREGYTYLSKSIRSFMFPESLAEIMRQAGFQDVAFYRLLGGVAAVHRGRSGNG